MTQCSPLCPNSLAWDLRITCQGQANSITHVSWLPSSPECPSLRWRVTDESCGGLAVELQVAVVSWVIGPSGVSVLASNASSYSDSAIRLKGVSSVQWTIMPLVIGCAPIQIEAPFTLPCKQQFLPELTFDWRSIDSVAADTPVPFVWAIVYAIFLLTIVNAQWEWAAILAALCFALLPQIYQRIGTAPLLAATWGGLILFIVIGALQLLVHLCTTGLDRLRFPRRIGLDSLCLFALFSVLPLGTWTTYAYIDHLNHT